MEEYTYISSRYKIAKNKYEKTESESENDMEKDNKYNIYNLKRYSYENRHKITEASYKNQLVLDNKIKIIKTEYDKHTKDDSNSKIIPKVLFKQKLLKKEQLKELHNKW